MFTLPTLPSKQTLLAVAALFLVGGFIVYGAALSSSFVQWDDGLLIYNNPAVMEVSFSSLKRMFTTYDPELYIPFTLLSYQFDYVLGGGSPFLFHLQSLLWHCINALLVSWVLFLLVRNKVAALAGGLLFLVHPLNTEAVVWASGRKDVLSTAFFLLSVLSYFYSRERSERWLYILSLIFFAIGLMAKVMIVTMPLLVVLLVYGMQGKILKKDVHSILPHVGLSVLFGIVALFGKSDVNSATTLLQKILMAAKSTVFYVQSYVLPTKLSVVYPYQGDIVISNPTFYSAQRKTRELAPVDG